jgi:multidrug transporter EmrE-like cation transporter
MSLSEIILITVVETIGDFGYKQFADHGGIFPFAIGTLGYLGVVGLLIVTLQNSTVLMVNGAWDGISGLFESACAYIFLGERFQDPLQYVGLLMIAGGLYLLKIPLKKTKPFVFPSFFPKK